MAAPGYFGLINKSENSSSSLRAEILENFITETQPGFQSGTGLSRESGWSTDTPPWESLRHIFSTSISLRRSFTSPYADAVSSANGEALQDPLEQSIEHHLDISIEYLIVTMSRSKATITTTAIRRT